MCEGALVSTDPTVTSLGASQQAHVYSTESDDCTAFLSNYDLKSSIRIMFNNMHYTLPPWSISIFSDCRNVVFNTAKRLYNHCLGSPRPTKIKHGISLKLGSTYGTREYKRITYTSRVNLRARTNRIALLSVAIGLPNVGEHYESWNTGNLGPVSLPGLDQGKWDLLWKKWTYQ
ncbi:hypothetical protein S245_030712, partial [Arachis hypogaea]